MRKTKINCITLIKVTTIRTHSNRNERVEWSCETPDTHWIYNTINNRSSYGHNIRPWLQLAFLQNSKKMNWYEIQYKTLFTFCFATILPFFQHKFYEFKNYWFYLLYIPIKTWWTFNKIQKNFFFHVSITKTNSTDVTQYSLRLKVRMKIHIYVCVYISFM